MRDNEWGRFKKRTLYKPEHYKGKKIYFKSDEDGVIAILKGSMIGSGFDKREAFDDAKDNIDAGV